MTSLDSGSMDFDAFLRRLGQIGARELAIEFAILAACVGLAWGVCRWFGRDQHKDSIWFGTRVFDGLLFPLLALLLTDLARRAMLNFQPVLVLRIAVSVFIALVVIRFFARVLHAVFPDSGFTRLLERTISWVAWIGAILWIVGLLPTVLAEFDSITLAFGRTRVSLRTVLEDIVSTALVLAVALWIASAIEERILRPAVADLSMRKVASNAVRALLLLIGLLVVLSAIGVDLTSLSVLGGAVGVGLGFGLQKLAANYVSGFVILLERSIRIGDNVRVDGFEGRVTDIKTRYTLVRSGNGRESIVPNEALITSRVENLSQADLRFNIQINIVVDHDSDVRKVQAILCAAAIAQPRVLDDPAPVAFLLNFVPDGMEFSLNIWISDPDKGRDNIRSAINIAILDALRIHNIAIAKPHRVVHVTSLPADGTS
jgi:small-conductance mechanosensitive channel